MVISEGVEPSIFWMRTRRPGPLDDETNNGILTGIIIFCKFAKLYKPPHIKYNNPKGRRAYKKEVIMQIVRRHWRIVFPIIIAIIIWAFSAQNGEASDAKSIHYAEMFGLTNIAMRKIAHIILFGAFSYSLCSYFKGLYPYVFPNYNLVAYSAIISVVYGAIDEVHQLTVAGRTALISDVFIEQNAVPSAMTAPQDTNPSVLCLISDSASSISPIIIRYANTSR